MLAALKIVIVAARLNTKKLSLIFYQLKKIIIA
jgi:hypothetical protein